MTEEGEQVNFLEEVNMKLLSLIALSLFALSMIIWTPNLSASQVVGANKTIELADHHGGGHGGGHHGGGHWGGGGHHWDHHGWDGGWGGSYYYPGYNSYYYNSYPGYDNYYYYDPYNYDGSGVYFRFGF